MSKGAPAIVPPLADVDWVLAVSRTMGVSKSRAAAALEANSNDVDAACEAIIAGEHEEGADDAAVALTAQEKVAQLSSCCGVNLEVAITLILAVCSSRCIRWLRTRCSRPSSTWRPLRSTCCSGSSPVDLTAPLSRT